MEPEATDSNVVTADSAQGPIPAPVRFRLRNIGPVREAELELGNFTVIAGRNNTGKTYLVYTVYGFLKHFQQLVKSAPFARPDYDLLIKRLADKAIKEGVANCRLDQERYTAERGSAIRTLSARYSQEHLAATFSSSSSDAGFENASIEVELDEREPTEGALLETKISKSGRSLSLYYKEQMLSLSFKGPMERLSPRFRFLYQSQALALYFRFLFPEFVHETSILSAERFGISLFYKELDLTKNELVDILQNMNDKKATDRISPFLFLDRIASRYALPVKDNINFTRSISEMRRQKSELSDRDMSDEIKKIMRGYYSSNNDEIRFKSTSRRGGNAFNIPLHLASSSARGLSDLYFFLRHVACHNHLLIIDEPEGHLDTANQVLLARTLAHLIRFGIRILITTHSDYLLKEINNLIMLSAEFPNRSKVMQSLKYSEGDYIEPQSIRAYVAEKNSLTACLIDDLGVEFPLFEEVINDINRASNEIASRVRR